MRATGDMRSRFTLVIPEEELPPDPPPVDAWTEPHEHNESLQPAPASGRLVVVSLYFAVSGVLGALATIALAAAIADPSLGFTTTPKNPVVALAAGWLLTYGSFRTTYLLSRRTKAGGQLAAACLACSFIGSVQAGQYGWFVLGLPVVGLALLAAAWRHLD
jgi:hypothetical protein